MNWTTLLKINNLKHLNKPAILYVKKYIFMKSRKKMGFYPDKGVKT